MEKIKDEMMNMISGGRLSPGWEKNYYQIMRVYKSQYGDEEGLKRVKQHMYDLVDDNYSFVEESDLKTLFDFIDNNWDSVETFEIPKISKIGID